MEKIEAYEIMKYLTDIDCLILEEFIILDIFKYETLGDSMGIIP